MKKNLLTIVLTVITIILCVASILSIDTSEDINNGRTHDIEEYIVDIDYKKDFRILQLSDIHLGTKDDIEEHLDFMALTINEANADLIELNGDIFTYANKRVAKRLFEFIDGFGVPWTLVFGNHDEQCSFPIDWLTDYLNNYGSNCVFKDVAGDDVFGCSNHAVNLIENGKTKYQLIFIDSNRYYFGDYIGYDYIKPSQIKWYERLIENEKNKNGKVVDSLLFFHIPFEEFNTAWYEAGGENAVNAIKAQGGGRDENSKKGLESHIDYSEYTKQYGKQDAVFEYGFAEPYASSPKYNSKFFDTILKLGSTKGVFVSHDHTYNSRILYKGVYLGFSVNSTDRVIRDNNMMGGHVIVIHDDNTLTFEHIYHTYEDIDNE